MSAGIFDPYGTRLPSQVIKSEDEYRQQAQGQSDYLGSLMGQFGLQTPDQLAASFYNPIISNAQAQATDQGYSPTQQNWDNARSAFANAVNSGDYGRQVSALGGQQNYDTWNAYANGGYQAANVGAQDNIKALQDAQAAASAEATRQANERAQNQQIQQGAYSGMLGGGNVGGVLTPNAATGTSATGFGSAGVMGATAGATTTPLGGASNLGMGSAPTWTGNGFSSGGMMGAGQPSTGWGGPFSYKNPWSFGG